LDEADSNRPARSRDPWSRDRPQRHDGASRRCVVEFGTAGGARHCAGPNGACRVKGERPTSGGRGRAVPTGRAGTGSWAAVVSGSVGRWRRRAGAGSRPARTAGLGRRASAGTPRHGEPGRGARSNYWGAAEECWRTGRHRCGEEACAYACELVWRGRLPPGERGGLGSRTAAGRGYSRTGVRERVGPEQNQGTLLAPTVSKV